MGKKRSEVWNHYKPLEGNLKALCRYCDKTVSILGGSISNLSRHLKKKHQKLCLEQLPAGEVVSFNESHEHQLTQEGEADGNATSAEVTLVSESLPPRVSDAVSKSVAAVLSITKNTSSNSRKNQSEVWDHFTKYQSPDQTRRLGKCHYCPKVVSSSGGISNLKRHLARHHPELFGGAELKTAVDEICAEDFVEDPQETETLGKNGSEGQDEPPLPPEAETSFPTELAVALAEPRTVTGSVLQNKNQRKSRVWAHFTPNETNTKGKCNYCGAFISICYGSVGNLYRHLKKKHPKVRIKNLCPQRGQKEKKTEFIPVFAQVEGQPEQFRLIEQVVKVPASKKRVSDVWKHFTKLRNADNTQIRGECHYCKRLVSASAGSISNLKRHLRKKHPKCKAGESSIQQPAETSVVPSIRQKFTSKTLTARNEELIVCENYLSQTAGPVVLKLNTSGPSLGNFHGPITAEMKKGLNRQLVKFICKGFHQPSNFLDGEGFNELIQALCPAYEMPSPDEFKNSLLPQAFEEVVLEVQAKLNAASAVCLSAEAWTTSKEKCFVTLNAHYLIEEDQNLVPCCSVLSCAEFTKTYAPDNIAVWFQSIVLEWGLENKILGIVTNNSVEMAMAVEFCNWHHIPCFAHIFNSIILKGLKAVEEIIAKIRTASEFIGSDPQILNNFYETQKQFGLPKCKLKTDIPDVWKTTSKMLERFLVNKDCIFPILTQYNYDEQDLQNLNNILETVDSVIKILSLFSDVVVDLSEEIVGLSRIPILLRIIVDRLESFPSEPNEVKIMRSVILEEFNDKLNLANLERDTLIGHSVLLDPRFKKEGFSSEIHFNHFKSTIIDELESLQAPTSSTSHDMTVSKAQSSSLWADFDKFVKKASDASNQPSGHVTELESYLSESLISRTANPLSWWNDRKAVYHSLYTLMLKRLCTPVSSVQFSRLFSKEGYLLSNRRFHLNSSKLVLMIAFLHQNL